MRNDKPLISVIVPCYKQSKYLADALNSVLAQTYENWECIIVDDDSPDNTKDVAFDYCSKDERFHYFKKKNEGLSAARNYGVSNSHGQYILPLDADDKIGSEYLELAIDALEKDSKIRLVYCKAVFFGEKEGEWNLPSFSVHSLLERNSIFCSAIYRRTDFDAAGGYDINYRHGGEDWDLWLSILNSDEQVYRIDKILFFYRIKKRSMSKSLQRSQTNVYRMRCYMFRKHKKLSEKHVDVLLNEYEYLIHLIEITPDYKVGEKVLYLPRIIRTFLHKILFH